MPVNTQYRSTATEIMDDFDLRGPELADALGSIARLNRVLGGNRLTMQAVEDIVAQRNMPGPVRILDLGCGNGDMLRTLAVLAKKKKYEFRMMGIDANAFTVQNATSLSASYPEIRYRCADLLDPDLALEDCDIILLTLTLHHFSEQEILALLERSASSARLAIVVNDLQRSRIAYLLFGWISKLFRLNPMNDTDGKLSILRGFKKKDLVQLAEKMNFKQYTIRWKWAFRYQWIITDL